MPETPRESRDVKGLGRVIGVFPPPPLNTLAGLSPVHNAKVRVQHSTPRKCNSYGWLPGMLRGSRGDRVMTPDTLTCPNAP